MKRKNALMACWAVVTMTWLLAVGSSILPHYAPLLTASQYLYNPMVHPDRLMVPSDEHRELLVRSHFPGQYRLDAFGIEDTVRIEHMIEVTHHDEFRTWMPHGRGWASIPTTSPEWLAFRERLIAQALSLRAEEQDRILKEHAILDALVLLGVPLMWLMVIFAYRANASLLDQPAQGRFPDP